MKITAILQVGSYRMPTPTIEAKDGPAGEGNASDDFIIQVYGQLWQNINTRDTRVWTYLGFYGAALALLFGLGSQLPGGGLQIVFLALILTTWACLLIISANWWFTRNLLFITGVEYHFEHSAGGETINRIIPPEYRDRKFDFEAGYRASLGIFGILWLSFYSAEVIELVVGTKELDSAVQVVTYLLVTLSAVVVAWILVSRQRHYVVTYYKLKKGLWDQRKEVKETTKAELDRQREQSTFENGLVKPLFYLIALLFLISALLVAWAKPLSTGPSLAVGIFVLAVILQPRGYAYTHGLRHFKKLRGFRYIWSCFFEGPNWPILFLSFVIATAPILSELIQWRFPKAPPLSQFSKIAEPGAAPGERAKELIR